MTPDKAKAAAEMIATMWEAEFPTTCAVIAAVNDEKRDYKPDAKSRTAWQLATHIAMADLWFIESIAAGKFEFDREKAKAMEDSFSTIDEVVAFYKKNFPGKLRALAAMPADRMSENIDFYSKMNRSRAEWIGFASNHSIHHRGQLAAYLRAMGSKVPSIYGPSADVEG